MKLAQAKNVHLIGIGGIGMSALAKWLHWRQIKVSGSDITDSEVVASLPREITVSVGPQTESNVPSQTEAIVYSQAVSQENPERAIARMRAIPEFSYAQAIADLAEGYETIAVAGTHGKTSTVGMVGSILETAGLDPTVIIGSLIKSWQGNFRPGRSRLLVLEADEYARSFLNYRPNQIIITNIDRDHLDTYRDEAEIMDAFKQFCGNLKAGGRIIINQDDKNIRTLAAGISQPLLRYSLLQPEKNLKWLSEDSRQVIDIEGLGVVRLNVPGRHMTSNALAAITLSQFLGIKSEYIINGLANYHGAWRRFDRIGEFNGAPVISDYAHHPVEINATIESARKAFPGQRLIVIFQPHQKKRTRSLYKEFVEALNKINGVMIIDIYDVAGRENNTADNISSRILVEDIKAQGGSAQYLPNVKELTKILSARVNKNDAVLFLGAGDIHKIALKILKDEQ